MRLNIKDVLVFAAIFALGACVYMIGEVLNDLDVSMVRMQYAFNDLNQCNNN